LPARGVHIADKPLRGLRFAAKVVFRVRGSSTSLGNKAYLSISPRSDFTALTIQTILDAGAHIVGLTKLSSMIGREEPTETTDYQAPFNPRADGYQSPAGSSSGSAAAVAAYDWLDFALGTDTTGSGRRPALVNGVFKCDPPTTRLFWTESHRCFPLGMRPWSLLETLPC
jgi:Asp-tRNA(Asn)/Glu-tRNA(Gln) amidotransferase A subunit family amidase